MRGRNILADGQPQAAAAEAPVGAVVGLAPPELRLWIVTAALAAAALLRRRRARPIRHRQRSVSAPGHPSMPCGSTGCCCRNDIRRSCRNCNRATPQAAAADRRAQLSISSPVHCRMRPMRSACAMRCAPRTSAAGWAHSAATRCSPASARSPATQASQVRPGQRERIAGLHLAIFEAALEPADALRR